MLSSGFGGVPSTFSTRFTTGGGSTIDLSLLQTAVAALNCTTENITTELQTIQGDVQRVVDYLGLLSKAFYPPADRTLSATTTLTGQDYGSGVYTASAGSSFGPNSQTLKCAAALLPPGGRGRQFPYDTICAPRGRRLYRSALVAAGS